jgi:uncharacterized membrane protein
LKNGDNKKRLRAVFLIGIAIALLIMLIGMIAFAFNPQDDDTALQWEDLSSGLAEMNPVAIIDIGIVILMVVPIDGIIVIAILSSRDKDKNFAFISILVLIILTIGFILALFR